MINKRCDESSGEYIFVQLSDYFIRIDSQKWDYWVKGDAHFYSLWIHICKTLFTKYELVCISISSTRVPGPHYVLT